MKEEIIKTKSYVSVPTSEQVVVSDDIDKCKALNTVVKITQHNLNTMYWIPKLHEKPFKARFISNYRSCTTINISTLMTSCLSKIKDHFELYCDKAYQNSGTGIDLLWSF